MKTLIFILILLFFVCLCAAIYLSFSHKEKKTETGDDFKSINPAKSKEGRKFLAETVTKPGLSKSMKRKINEKNANQWKCPRFIPSDVWKSYNENQRRQA